MLDKDQIAKSVQGIQIQYKHIAHCNEYNIKEARILKYVKLRSRIN